MNNFKTSTLIAAIALTATSLTIHAQEPEPTPQPENSGIDIIGGFGYSIYSIQNSSSNPSGFNVNISASKNIFKINDNLDFIIGPTLKYEQVSSNKFVSNGLFSFQEKLTFSTIQIGAEIGVKYTIFPKVHIYETVGGSYGIYNQLSTNITNGGILIPDQRLTASVNNSYNVGLNSRGLFSVTPNFHLGAGVYVGYGSYAYNSGTVNTPFGGVNTDSGSENFINTNINLIAAFTF